MREFSVQTSKAEGYATMSALEDCHLVVDVRIVKMKNGKYIVEVTRHQDDISVQVAEAVKA